MKRQADQAWPLSADQRATAIGRRWLRRTIDHWEQRSRAGDSFAVRIASYYKTLLLETYEEAK